MTIARPKREVALAAAIILIAVAIVVAVTHRSTPDPRPNGPLGPSAGVGRVTECVPVPHVGQAATITVATFSVPATTRPITTDAVAMEGSHDATIVGAVLVPHRNVGVGYFSSYPPPRAALEQDGVQWNRRQDVAGAQLRPTAAGEAVDLVVGLKATTATPGSASFRWMSLRYHVGRQRFTFETTVGATVVVAPGRCPG